MINNRRSRSRALLAALAALTLVAGLVGYVAAVHADGVFQLDGNALASDPGSPARTGDDWDQLDDGFGDPNNDDSALVSAFTPDDLSQVTDQIYTGGSTKDDLNTTGWRHTAGSVPDKDNLEHAFAAMYNTCADGIDAGDALDQCLFFGLDRFARNGDAQVGFWFFKNAMTPLADGTFANPHAVGDILVLSNFTNGGVVGGVQVYRWVGSGGDTNGTLDLLAAEGECATTVNDPDEHDTCGESNTSVIDSPWFFDAKTGPNNKFPQGSFYEGGINLNSLGLGGTCISSFIAETRSSQSVDAVLKDFAYGQFNVCSANIQIGDDGTNPVGTPHTVTGHVNVVQGGVTSNAPAGTVITFTIVSGPGTLTPPTPTTCATIGVTGSCSVTLNSSVTGTTVVHAASDVTSGGQTIHVETNGTSPNSDDLQKIWIQKYQIIVITCDDTGNALVDGTVNLESGADTATITDTQFAALGWLQADGVTPVTEADFCAQAGANFGNLDGGTYSLSVEVPTVP